MGKVLEAAIYDRVSDDRSNRRKSVGQQNAANRAACDANGWRVAGVYEDNDLSASRFAREERPDWQRLVADLEGGRFQVLVMWETSRGDRELEMWARLLNTCRRLGILIHIESHGHTYDVRKPRDWRTLAEDGVDNAYESEKTSLRVRRDMAATAAEGKPHGRILFGYRREYDPRTGRLIRQVADDRPSIVIRSGCMVRQSRVLEVATYTKAGLVHELVGRALESVATYTLAAGLNMHGIPTPRRSLAGWSHTQVRDLLLNPGYAGLRVHKGQVVGAADWDPLIEPDQHYALVALLTDPARRKQRDVAVRHLLSGIAVCSVCGGELRVIPSRGRLVYICRPRSPSKGLGHVGRDKLRLEEFVTGAIVGWLAREDAAEAFAAASNSSELGAILSEIAEKRDRLEAFYDQAASGTLSPTGLARVEKRLLGDIDRLEGRARSMRQVPLLTDIAHPDRQVVAERWEALEMTQRREVVRSLCERITVLPLGPGRKKYNDWEYVEILWRARQSVEGD